MALIAKRVRLCLCRQHIRDASEPTLALDQSNAMRKCEQARIEHQSAAIAMMPSVGCELEAEALSPKRRRIPKLSFLTLCHLLNLRAADPPRIPRQRRHRNLNV